MPSVICSCISPRGAQEFIKMFLDMDIKDYAITAVVCCVLAAVGGSMAGSLEAMASAGTSATTRPDYCIKLKPEDMWSISASGYSGQIPICPE